MVVGRDPPMVGVRRDRDGRRTAIIEARPLSGISLYRHRRSVPAKPRAILTRVAWDRACEGLGPGSPDPVPSRSSGVVPPVPATEGREGPPCPVCGDAAERGDYCAGCCSYAGWDALLASERDSALRRLALARSLLEDGRSVEDVASSTALAVSVVAAVAAELDADLDHWLATRPPIRFQPRLNSRERRRDRRVAQAGSEGP